MRLLFTRFPLESAHGGAENQTMWLSTGLREKGHTVSFIGSCAVLLQTFSASGFDATQLAIGVPPVTKWSAVSFLWRRKEMQKSLIDALDALPERPDAIFMLSLSEKLLLTDYAHSKGIKVFWIEHDRIGPWLTLNPWLPALKKASTHAVMICVSELSRKLYIEMGFDPARVIAIPNGVPSPSSPAPFSRGEKGRSQLHPHSPPPSGEEGLGVRVGCIARLSPEKGIDVLLHALENIPEVSLDIVGTGPDEGYLRTLIHQDTERMGGERICIKKSVASLDDFYAEIDVLVLPSREHDPFGLVVAEAMVRGVPVIMTDACGIAGYLRREIDALIVRANDPHELAEAIRRILEPSLRKSVSEQGQKTARALFSVERMVDGYEKLFSA